MKKPKQLSFVQAPQQRRQHGGSLAVRRRRSARPMSRKLSLHITLKSHHAIGGRCLFRHKKMISAVMRKSAARFCIKIYEHAICGNHLHLLVKGPNRESLQNFFRVLAGHTAQNILRDCPLPQKAGGAPGLRDLQGQREEKVRLGCKKNQRKFWSYLLYSRVVSWGREFKIVKRYVQRNTLEALQLIAYQPRLLWKSKVGSSNTS